MTRPYIPELNDSEQMLALELLWTFLETPWRNWTCCSGMKRPYVWQTAKRRAFKAIVARNKALMDEMVCSCDFSESFVFSAKVGVVHAIKYRKDFCRCMVAVFPMRRLLFSGNDSLRGGMLGFNVAA